MASRTKYTESSKVHYVKDIKKSRVESAERVSKHYHKDTEKSRGICRDFKEILC